MKLIKKILALCLVLVLVFTLVGCSTNSSSSKSSQSSSESSSTSSASSSSEASDEDVREAVKQTKYDPHIFLLEVGTSVSTPKITENGKELKNSEEERNLQNKLENFPFKLGYADTDSDSKKSYRDLCAIVALNKVVFMPLSYTDRGKENIKSVYASKAKFLKAYKKQKETYGTSTYTYKSGSHPEYNFTEFKNIPFYVANTYAIPSEHKQIIKLTRVGKAKVQAMYNKWPELTDDDNDPYIKKFSKDKDLILTGKDFTFTNGVSSKNFKIKYTFSYELTNNINGLEKEINEMIENDSDRFDD
ncbi:hypothetical protein [Lactobacillus sp. PV012]|uniref:hypothetical protein n=1 Tax=Lactobacillus sp. PV012 TaxID=2594494 RepID=UPI00223EDD34|nr:hypothetical protein [Lactobacillus sp. PV012]QNQ82756.1 hypothetical protein FP433_06760 [Lactobacillus sp. PV012]